MTAAASAAGRDGDTVRAGATDALRGDDLADLDRGPDALRGDDLVDRNQGPDALRGAAHPGTADALPTADTFRTADDGRTTNAFRTADDGRTSHVPRPHTHRTTPTSHPDADPLPPA
ncbi:hypothetical protein, partial [Streptomyces sp. SID4985]|uniref:hypothetical protein n=1 Tax=Streptomyces sp. SID4985 TaxID=2690292 RepID=UPI001F3755C7